MPDPANNTPDDSPSLADQLLEGQDLDALESEADGEPQDDHTPEPAASGEGDPPEDPPESPSAADDDFGEPEGGDQFDLVQRLADMGFQDVSDPEEAQRRLLEAYTLTHAEREQYEQQVRQLEPLANYGTQYIAQQRQQQSQPEGPATPEGKKPDQWWNPPQFDHLEAERYREFDPTTGTQRWKEDTPPEVKVAAQQYQQYLEKWSQDLVHRPQEVLPKIIEQEFDRLFEDRYGSRVRKQTEASFYDTMEEQNAHWLYEIDPVTKRVRQDREGYPVTTPAGEMMLGQMDRLKKKGMTDAEDIWEFALSSVKAYYGQGQRANEEASEAAREEARRKREEHRKRGSGSIPERGGSFNKPEEPGNVPQNTKLSIGDRLLQEAEASGEVIWST